MTTIRQFLTEQTVNKRVGLKTIQTGM